jgi:hypothetical protein
MMEFVAQWLPMIVLGAIGGWILHALNVGTDISTGDMLTAFVTVLVGWWVQRALTHQGELNKVPIETVAHVCERIEALTEASLDREPIGATDNDLLAKLALLSNEIDWLDSIARELKIETEPEDDLVAVYLRFKAALTDRRSIPAAAARAREMRTKRLVLQWQISRRIVGQAADLVQLLSGRHPKR